MIPKQSFITSSTERIDNYYDIKNDKKEIIGRGNFGIVLKGIHKATKVKRAVKVIKKTNLPDTNKFVMELNIMKQLDHPNVIKLIEVFEDRKYIYFVMELCTGGELFESIIDQGAYSEEMARDAFVQLIKAIQYLHSVNVCHRDIKPENLLFLRKESRILKLIDFGISKFFVNDAEDAKKQHTKAGSLFYISPEVLVGNYDKRTDIWSAGVILYILLAGYPPFFDEQDCVVISKINEGNYSTEGDSWNHVSDDAKDLISKMIVAVDDRISSKNILSHPWLQNHSLSSNYKLSSSGIKNFYKSHKFKRIALSAMVFHSDVDIDELGKLFLSIDKDGDGHLSYDELMEGIEQHLGEESMEVLEIYKQEITPGTRINYNEFVASLANLQDKFKQEVNLRKAFNTFDTNKDGIITANELKELLSTTEEYSNKPQEFWEAIINDADTNHDGEIDYQEFVDMMLSKI